MGVMTSEQRSGTAVTGAKPGSLNWVSPKAREIARTPPTLLDERGERRERRERREGWW